MKAQALLLAASLTVIASTFVPRHAEAVCWAWQSCGTTRGPAAEPQLPLFEESKQVPERADVYPGPRPNATMPATTPSGPGDVYPEPKPPEWADVYPDPRPNATRPSTTAPEWAGYPEPKPPEWADVYAEPRPNATTPATTASETADVYPEPRPDAIPDAIPNVTSPATTAPEMTAVPGVTFWQ